MDHMAKRSFWPFPLLQELSKLSVNMCYMHYTPVALLGSTELVVLIIQQIRQPFETQAVFQGVWNV